MRLNIFIVFLNYLNIISDMGNKNATFNDLLIFENFLLYRAHYQIVLHPIVIVQYCKTLHKSDNAIFVIPHVLG